MADDLPHWVGHYADMLGCDSYPAAVAVAIEALLAEREQQRKTIGRLRGLNAALVNDVSESGRVGGQRSPRRAEDADEDPADVIERVNC